MILPSGNLQISKVRKTDQGSYKCISINPLTAQKRVANHVVFLNVIGEYPDYFLLWKLKFYASANSTRVMKRKKFSLYEDF